MESNGKSGQTNIEQSRSSTAAAVCSSTALNSHSVSRALGKPQTGLIARDAPLVMVPNRKGEAGDCTQPQNDCSHDTLRFVSSQSAQGSTDATGRWSSCYLSLY